MKLLKMFAAILLGLSLAACGGPSSRKLTEAKANRAKILSLIAVGDSLAQAEAKLKAAGFQLANAQPVDPTGRGEYIQQLVLVHPALLKPSAQSSFRYTVGLEPSKSEPVPYVVIDADTAGRIIRLR